MTAVAELTKAGEKPQSTENQRAYRAKVRKHKLLVHVAQLAVLVVVVGGWQLYVGDDSKKIILYGVPSGIIDQLKTWINH
jgi:NitT/TauT family transport system permease protein